MRKNFEWFENSVIFKVPSAYPGYLRKVYPGFLQHAGFVAMNPDRHLNSHWDYYLDLVKGDMDDVESHRGVLRRVQRRDRPAGGVLPRHHPDRVPGASPAQRHVGRARPAVSPEDITIGGALHDRGRARRHLRQRPDAGGARLVQGHSEVEEAAPGPPKAPATTASSAGAAGANRSLRRSGIFIREHAERWPASRPAIIRQSSTRLAHSGQSMSDSTTALADRIDALLPQTQCTKCGYDGCRPYAEAIAAGAR